LHLYNDPEGVDLRLNPETDEFGEVRQASLKIRGHLSAWIHEFAREFANRVGDKYERIQSGFLIDDPGDETQLFSTGSELSYFIFVPSQQLSKYKSAIILKRTASSY
jgi:hypothetical protein